MVEKSEILCNVLIQRTLGAMIFIIRWQYSIPILHYDYDMILIVAYDKRQKM